MPHRLLSVILLGFPFCSVQAAGGFGMTWGNNTNAATGDGVVFVTCHGLPRTQAGSCNAYTGDTACSTELPLLCLEVDGRPRPPGLITPETRAAMPSAFYAGWAAGSVAATAPVAGSRFSHRTEADAFCRDEFGAGWRLAEFHDGIVEGSAGHGGWAWYAHGRLALDTRYWVAISDTQANCWDSPAEQHLQASRPQRPADGAVKSARKIAD
jgi:hypothetical protein